VSSGWGYAASRNYLLIKDFLNAVTDITLADIKRGASVLAECADYKRQEA
jgi:hypothetical protein